MSITAETETKTAIEKTQWFKLNHKNKDGDIVEYSTDFEFFIKNQLIVWRSGTRHSFTSGLESKTFMTQRAYNQQGTFDKCDLIEFAKQIHKEILQGKHGSGQLVD